MAEDGRSEALRVQDIRERISRIREFTVGGRNAFFASTLIQDAVVRNIEVIGEAAKNIGPDTRELAPSVPWADKCGMRDFVAHAYHRLDLERVWQVVERRLDELDHAMSELQAKL
ncbi:MAG TPA: DUF86 domain-containing protein [Deinococcales bacterium]|nr:DUF86 domain-containing protein [Deinococcales bacterium]